MSRCITLPNDLLLGEVKKLIAQGHSVTLRVRGNSMMPLLHDNRDSVILAPFSSIQKGELVLAEIKQGVYVLHRIIKIDNQKITLMGDGNISGTEQCQISNIAGVAIEIIRNGKKKSLCGTWWNLYSSIWLALLPIRRYLLGIYRRIV